MSYIVQKKEGKQYGTVNKVLLGQCHIHNSFLACAGLKASTVVLGFSRFSGLATLMNVVNATPLTMH